MTYEWSNLCRCGCGEPLGVVSKATHYRLRRGDENVGWKRGHRHRKQGNPRWNGGRATTWSGHRLIAAPDHPNARPTGYILEHRLVMSAALDRPLRPDEIVHHRNKIKTDNRLDNLELTTRTVHTSHHVTHGDVRRPLTNPPTERTCPICGTTFMHRRNTCCSRACTKRYQVGEHAARARVTDAEVAAIRAIGASIPQWKVAAQFNVSKTQIGRILRGESR